MIKYSIVLVPFPFDDFLEVKPRPALCLTNDIGKLQHIIIAFISSNLGNAPIIRKNSTNWNGTGLLVDSVIRLHKIVTIPKILIKRRLGRINQNIEKDVLDKIKQLFEK